MRAFQLRGTCDEPLFDFTKGDYPESRIAVHLGRGDRQKRAPRVIPEQAIKLEKEHVHRCENEEGLADKGDSERSGGLETILVVEDEPQIRVLVRVFLQRRGYIVFEAENGTEAMEQFEKAHGRIDLLLTDLKIPGGLDGATLAEYLCSKNANLKVVYCTGYAGEAGLKLRHGVTLLQKPFTPNELASCIRTCLDGLPEKGG